MIRNSILNKSLCRALSLKRPHKGIGEQTMLNWIADNVPTNVAYHWDALGNLHVDMRASDANRTLFVAHVDTVHREDGPNKINKTRNKWYACGAPLGADDGAGIAVLMQLMHRDIKAYYIFTVGEECGGIGASHIGKQQDFLYHFDRAIAFDRRGTDSIITHQAYGRCCSDEFADALAVALMDANPRLMYLADNTGVYTDTAEFVDTIPECTNISVGYDHEHSDRESLDVSHLVNLANAVCRVEWDTLPTKRDPKVFESKWGITDWGYKSPEMGATSVNSLDDYVDDDTADLAYAIEDAMYGMKQSLIDLMSEVVYPEDPTMAARYIDPRKIDDDLLDTLWDMAHTYDVSTVLCYMFDAIYEGAY